MDGLRCIAIVPIALPKAVFAGPAPHWVLDSVQGHEQTALGVFFLAKMPPAPALCFGPVLSAPDSAQDKVLFETGAADGKHGV